MNIQGHLYIPISGKGKIKAVQVKSKDPEARAPWKTVSFDYPQDQSAHLIKINFRLYSLLQVPGLNMDNFSNDVC